MVKAKMRTFNVYRVNHAVLGYEIDWTPFPASMRGYKHSFVLEGREAAYCIVTDDETITRSIAIEFAQAIFQGRYRTINVDLSSVNDDLSRAETNDRRVC